MLSQKNAPERVTSFSDGVFAVIITIMVLDLKPPVEPTLHALLPLWPTALSYGVSYLFIAIIWVNHHHLFQLIHESTPQLVWLNFAHLFYDFACAGGDVLDGGNEAGGCSSLYLCHCVCAGGGSLYFI